MINTLMPKINKNVLWALFRLNEKVPTEVKRLKSAGNSNVQLFNQELENISELFTALCINVHSLCHIFASFFAYGAVINGLLNIMHGS